jgi:hypothetical protein
MKAEWTPHPRTTAETFTTRESEHSQAWESECLPYHLLWFGVLANLMLNVHSNKVVQYVCLFAESWPHSSYFFEWSSERKLAQKKLMSKNNPGFILGEGLLLAELLWPRPLLEGGGQRAVLVMMEFAEFLQEFVPF